MWDVSSVTSRGGGAYGLTVTIPLCVRSSRLSALKPKNPPALLRRNFPLVFVRFFKSGNLPEAAANQVAPPNSLSYLRAPELVSAGAWPEFPNTCAVWSVVQQRPAFSPPAFTRISAKRCEGTIEWWEKEKPQREGVHQFPRKPLGAAHSRGLDPFWLISRLGHAPTRP